VVFDELYKIMMSAEAPRWLRSEEALEGVNLTHSQLVDIQRGYAHVARLYLERVDPARSEAATPWAWLASEHAELASWLMAGGAGSASELDAVLSRAVGKRYEVDGVARPVHARPVVYGWTLGREVDPRSPRVPAVPAIWPSDPNIRLAYTGLVEHVVWLRTQPSPLPELASTSVAWRVGGLIENLCGEDNSLRNQFSQLLGRCRLALDAAQWIRLAELSEWFDESRNVLTHFGKSYSGRTFLDEARHYCEPGYGDTAVEAATVFVFRQAALEVTEASDNERSRYFRRCVRWVSADLDRAAEELGP
jgi:hypothetical protein